jgi:hypothetical protein
MWMARSDCTYLHRLPPSDLVLPDASLDVFGREKWADYRDDMVRNLFFHLFLIDSGTKSSGVIRAEWDPSIDRIGHST